jgi:hypothetical protein
MTDYESPPCAPRSPRWRIKAGRGGRGCTIYRQRGSGAAQVRGTVEMTESRRSGEDREAPEAGEEGLVSSEYVLDSGGW